MEGMRKDQKPWSIAEDSWEVLTNAYQWRGRVLKRSGYTLLGNLTNGTPVMGLRTQEKYQNGVQNLIAFDTTKAYLYNGSSFVFLPSIVPVTWSGSDSQFFYTTNYAGGFWATNGKPGLNGVAISGVATGATTTITTSTNHGFTTGQTVAFINVGGVVGLNGNSGVITVTSLTTFTVPITTSGAYTSGGMALNSQVSVTGQDGIRYYGVLTIGNSWANYNPPVDPNNALAGALLIFAYRGYLVFLNTTEGNDSGTSNYPNRARWTQIGTPYYSAPVPTFPNTQGIDPNAARDDLFGRGGANDAPTSEAIVGAGFIRDIIIVYFERSTWRLRFVNNAQNPFVWERVNVELGSSCTYSSIIFDKGIMAISNRGIVMSDGQDTIRIDEKIPDEVFNIRQSNNGFNRVQGIRTFQTKLNYWTIPSDENVNGIYPDKVLVLNYDTRNWSYFDDCFTCFGYNYPTSGNQTWASLTGPWSTTSQTWDGGAAEIGYEQIIAGNQQGFVFVLEQTYGENAPSLNISAITNSTSTNLAAVFTSTNNNLPIDSWVRLSGVSTINSSDGVSLNNRSFQVANPTLNANTFNLMEYQPINGGNALGTSYTYIVSYNAIQPGSIQINIGALVFTDPALDGVLVESSSLGSGTINYISGLIQLTFSPSISSSQVWIRVVSLDPTQEITPIFTDAGIYPGTGGQIAKISGLDIQSKLFNFFKDGQRSHLSMIDFYVDSTTNGQFQCNIFADSSNDPVNVPLADNLMSNIVLTSTNPYQVGQGDETIFRLYSECIAQTLQVQLTYSDAQMAIPAYVNSDVQLLAMMVKFRPGGRTI